MTKISNQLNPNNGLKHKIYLAKQLLNVPTNEIYPQSNIPPTGVYCDLINKLKITDSLAESDYILIPHDWVHIYKNHNYVRYLQELSKDKPLLLFNTGDISPKVQTKNTLEIRTFLHPWEDSSQKIIIPYAVKARRYKPRIWKPVPSISFVGYVPKLTPGSLFGYNFKSLTHPLKSSVYIVRKFSCIRLRMLEPKFEIECIKRNQFTSYYKNPNLQAHSIDFQNSLDNSDYVLCPRGYGNTSMRFYESLSAGRTPILIDSSGGLPLINEKDSWADHIVNVKLLSAWTEIIKKDWSAMSKNNEYEIRQTRNQDLFNNTLSYNSYLTTLFRSYLKL